MLLALFINWLTRVVKRSSKIMRRYKSLVVLSVDKEKHWRKANLAILSFITHYLGLVPITAAYLGVGLLRLLRVSVCTRTILVLISSSRGNLQYMESTTTTTKDFNYIATHYFN